MTMADYSLDVGFDDLPDEVVRTAMSAVADTPASGIAAVDEDAPRT